MYPEIRYVRDPLGYCQLLDKVGSPSTINFAVLWSSRFQSSQVAGLP